MVAVQKSALLLCVSFVLIACSQEDPDVRVIDFSRRAELRLPEMKADDRAKLRVAIGAMISPRETASHYRQLLDYIAAQLDREIELVQRKTYGQLNALLDSGAVDLAFICSGPYAAVKKVYGFVGMAVPVVRGRHTYQSYLIVHKDSPFRQLQDLEGKSFAFTDPDSNTGRLVPTYWLALAGTTPERFFGKIIYTYSHDNSIMAVANGLVDGASVHQLIWEYYKETDPVHTSKTRVIKTSERFGNPVMVASAEVDPGLRSRVGEAMFTMHLDATGQTILNRMMIDRFVPPSEEWYRSIIAMQEVCTLSRRDD